MFYIYTVSFFGHREIEYFYKYEDELYELVCSLINKHPYVEFLVGRDGDFDQLASSVVQKAKRNFGKERCSLVWIMPYEKAEYTKNADDFDNYYDSVEICQASADVHPKAAIQLRNKYMVDRSDEVVFYVEHKSGGAYTTMKYAVKYNRKIVNIAKNQL